MNKPGQPGASKKAVPLSQAFSMDEAGDGDADAVAIPRISLMLAWPDDATSRLARRYFARDLNHREYSLKRPRIA